MIASSQVQRIQRAERDFRLTTFLKIIGLLENGGTEGHQQNHFLIHASFETSLRALPLAGSDGAIALLGQESPEHFGECQNRRRQGFAVV